MDKDELRNNLMAISTSLNLTPEELIIATDISHNLAISIASTLANLREDLVMSYDRAAAVMVFVLASETMAVTIAREDNSV